MHVTQASENLGDDTNRLALGQPKAYALLQAAVWHELHDEEDVLIIFIPSLRLHKERRVLGLREEGHGLQFSAYVDVPSLDRVGLLYGLDRPHRAFTASLNALLREYCAEAARSKGLIGPSPYILL